MGGPASNCTDMKRGPLRSLGRRLLLRPGSAAFARMLNLALRRDLPEDVYRMLLGRPVEIAVSDWGVRFRFAATARGFASIPDNSAIDLRFIATARDFALVAAGDEDPDTLYFSRRMVVEGDTELALLVKNSLDAIEGRRIRQLIRIAGGAATRMRQLHDRLRPHRAGV